MAIGILLTLLGIAMLCGLLFTLAVYALPVFIGLSAGLWAFETGGGAPGAVVVGLVVAAAALVAAQVLFAIVRSAAVRLMLAFAFAAPAAVAGYHAVLGLAAIGVPSEAWRQVFAVIGAVAVGATALARLTMLAEAPRQPAAAQDTVVMPPEASAAEARPYLSPPPSMPRLPPPR